MVNSHIACQQLGYKRAISLYTISQSNGLVLMDYVRCTGTEQRLVDCTFRGWGIVRQSCHNVGVVCSTTEGN